LSNASGSKVVTHEELKHILASYHKNRWRAIGLWALVFSLLVSAVLYARKREADQRVHDRNVQVGAIVTAGHQECLRAFGAMTAILHTTISKQRIEKATADERKMIDSLFSLADPKTNCPPSSGLTPKQKEILRQTTTSTGAN
jgi:hypothetical protein